MTLTLKSRQGTKLHYQFQLFEPTADRQPDRNKPYDLSGYQARFTIATNPPHVMETEDSHEHGHYLTMDPEAGTIDLECSAHDTATWSAGSIPFVLELIPPNGEGEKFEIVSGVLRLERFLG